MTHIITRYFVNKSTGLKEKHNFGDAATYMLFCASMCNIYGQYKLPEGGLYI
jgi:hypothetical protein